MTQPETPTPLRIDLRTVLEALAGSIGAMQVGIHEVGLSDTNALLAGLALLAVLTFVQRLLGKTGTDIAQSLSTKLSQLLAVTGARTAVLEAAVTPAVIRQADAAGAAVVGAPAPEGAKPTG